MPSFVVGVLLAVATTVPLAWKWQLGVARSAIATGIIAVTVGALLSALSNWLQWSWLVGAVSVWLFTVIAAAVVVAYRFYRDPERRCPEQANAIISPADGEVIYVRRSTAGTLPGGSKHGSAHSLVELTKTPLHARDGFVIGISMNFLDVHVNRAPMSGRISFQRHFPGRFGSLRLTEMIFQNERLTTLIEHGGVQVAVVQIASRLVRQIVSFVRVGETVARGQRIGAIRFGSQVDVVLPACQALRMVVAAGTRVRAGESVIAFLEDQQSAQKPDPYSEN